MSLFRNVALFYVMTIVSSVSAYALVEEFTHSVAITAAPVTEVAKNNHLDYIIMSAYFQRDNKDFIDEQQKNARLKRNEAEAEAAKLSLSRLVRLLGLTVRNMFYTRPIQDHPRLGPQKAALKIAEMIKKNGFGVK